MSTVTLPKTWVSGDVLTASDLNTQFSTLVNDYNGSISNVNIASNAAIDSTKISGTALVLTGAQTITGNKVITISSGAGLVVNNSGTGNGITINQTGNGRGLAITHDGSGYGAEITFTNPLGGGLRIITNRNDGWNTSGLGFNLVNAGTGIEWAFQFAGSEAVNAAVSGSQTYKVQCAVGDVTYYIPLYTG